MALTKLTPQMFDTSAAGHDFNIDNGTFVVDASANRVGIGTATPSTLLDVNGTLTATSIAGTLTTAAQTNITSVGTLGSLAVNSGTTNISATFTSTDGLGGIQLADTNGNVELVANGNNFEVRNAGGSAKLIIPNSGSATFAEGATFSGNVGIGTSPISYGNSQKALLIEDSGNPALCLSDTGQTRDWWMVALGDGLALRYADGGGSGSATNVTENMFLKNNGSVGIVTRKRNIY